MNPTSEAPDQAALSRSTRSDDEVALGDLLRAGGDARLDVEPSTGLSRYGTRCVPSPGLVSFASSTANTISADGYAAAAELFSELRSAARRGASAETYAAATESVKSRLVRHRGIPDAVVILGASGTDLELIALTLALGGHERPLVNIVVAPDETGSGSPLAAAGRHHGDRAPFASRVEKGQEVTGGWAGRVSVKTVELREPDGSVRLPAAVDAEVAAMVESAVAEGYRVLLHVMDASKTGIGGPSPSLANQLADRFGEEVLIAVDACQARLSAGKCQAYLRSGLIVMITGSKFIGGPPFSGAVLVPPALWDRVRDDLGIPAALRAYSARLDWPECPAAEVLDAPANVGLLLRWEAALCELARFDAVREEAVGRALEAVESHVVAEVARSGNLALLPYRPVSRDRRDEPSAWDARPSLFSIEARGATGALLDQDALNAVKQRMLLGAGGDGTAGGRGEPTILIGQAVRIGPRGASRAVLRVCLAARDLSAVGIRGGLASREFETVLGNLSLAIRTLSRRAAEYAG